jgi:acyl carrier protein
MARSAEADALIEYLKKNILGKSAPDIGEDTPLVSSGLMDSFALIEVLMEVEKVTKRKISPGKVGAKDMDTVTLMLATAQRVGIPRP